MYREPFALNANSNFVFPLQFQAYAQESFQNITEVS